MIQLFHVHKEYVPGIPALDDVSLSIGKGEFVFLTGPSGAGKTTLLKLLICEERPNFGQVHVAGKNLNYLKGSSIPYLRRNIGFVFQDLRLLQQKTVFDNVALPFRIIGQSPRVFRPKVNDLLKSVGLAHRADHYPVQLSRGEQQRVAIARALVLQPGILLADEPTVSLDEQSGWEIFLLLKEINLRGATVIVATHQDGMPKKFQRRKIYLEKGRIMYDEGMNSK